MHDPDSTRTVSRRALLRCGVGIGAAAAGMAVLGTAPAARGDEAAPAAGGSEAAPSTPAAALDRLRRGQARFAAGQPEARQRDLAHLRTLAPSQAPFAAVLGCSDSRVPVEILYDQGFGDLFVVRVAGNIATAVEIASLEFGTQILGAQAIVVLGHSNCGAVKAALSGGDVPGQISTLYQHIAPALERGRMTLAEAAVANVRYQVRRLRKGSPVIARLLEEKRLQVVGGVFDLETGAVNPVEI